MPHIVAVATIALSAAAMQLWNPLKAKADVLTDPTEIGTPGYITSSTDTIEGGSTLHLTYPAGQTSTSIIPPQGDYTFTKDNVVITNPDGSTKNAAIYHFDLTTQTANNGYLLVALQDVPAWVTALEGNPKYVEKQIANNEVIVTDSYGDTLTLVNFSFVANESGSIFGQTTSVTSGGKITLTHSVLASAPPTVNSFNATVGGQ